MKKENGFEKGKHFGERSTILGNVNSFEKGKKYKKGQKFRKRSTISKKG